MLALREKIEMIKRIGIHLQGVADVIRSKWPYKHGPSTLRGFQIMSNGPRGRKSKRFMFEPEGAQGGCPIEFLQPFFGQGHRKISFRKRADGNPAMAQTLAPFLS